MDFWILLIVALNFYLCPKPTDLNILFTLGTGRTNADSLIMEVGPDFCSYAYLDTSQKEFEFIRYHKFEEAESESAIKNILNGIEGSFNNIRIGSCFSQALLTPQSLFKEGHALMNLVYEPMDVAYRNDKVQEWQMITEYAVPAAIADSILSRFQQASFYHAFTPSLKIYNGFVAPDQADIHFSISHFRVLVKKAGQLQLAQIYAYKTPLDVVYYLLKIFYEFKLDQSEAFVIISGLVEQDSALYTELHHYFSNLHFAKAPAYGIPGNDHPQYYFTSLYNLAACAS